VCNVDTSEARAKLIASAVAKFGRIDILVSNVAVNPTFGEMLETTDEKTWDKIFDVNVKSHFFLIKEAVPHMPKGSSITLVSSYAGFTPNPFLGAYSVSKTALLGLTKVLSHTLGARGIRINCIAPGLIKTKFSSALWKTDGVSEKHVEGQPIKRLGEPEDCAGAVSFFASSSASYVTGETMVIGGGLQSRL